MVLNILFRHRGFHYPPFVFYVHTQKEGMARARRHALLGLEPSLTVTRHERIL